MAPSGVRHIPPVWQIFHSATHVAGPGTAPVEGLSQYPPQKQAPHTLLYQVPHLWQDLVQSLLKPQHLLTLPEDYIDGYSGGVDLVKIPAEALGHDAVTLYPCLCCFIVAITLHNKDLFHQ